MVRTPAKAQSFRDLRVWKSARELVSRAYALTARLPPHERFGLASQIQRAAVSIAANIAEGWGRGTRPEFHLRVTIARGSLQELDCLFDVAEDLAYLTAQDLIETRKLMSDEGRMLTALRHSLKRNLAR